MNVGHWIESRLATVFARRMIEFWVGFVGGWLVAASLPLIVGDVLGVVILNTLLWIIAVVSGQVCHSWRAKFICGGVLALAAAHHGVIFVPSVPIGMAFGSVVERFRWRLFLGFVAGSLATNGLFALGIAFS
jgi:hypothetical protein